jgi:hypothetical protein
VRHHSLCIHTKAQCALFLELKEELALRLQICIFESNELAGLAKANCVFSIILHNRETPTSSAYFYFFSGQRRGPARPRDDGIKALKERPYVAAPQGKENPSQRLA